MTNKYFNKEYIEYWGKRATNSGDGYKVPSEDAQNIFIDELNISPQDLILDLGCGYGRLYPTLSKLTQNIVGVDVDEVIIKKASVHPYSDLLKGSAEKTFFPPCYFEKIISWATYDAVEQDKALIEENRILKKNGLLLITGKNKDYHNNDHEAFIAERNAKLKNFPNHFTDVYKLIENAGLFGYRVIKSYGFPRRGDFGNLKYFNLLEENKKFYEFLMILQKIDEPKVNDYNICYEYSDTAIALSKDNNFENPKLFFQWHKENNQ